jgi:catechol 2,3-dioxygenase-like lactoylglutathione lyase family enzyme
MARLGNITFACDDPEALCSFWVEALGYERQEAPPAFMRAWIAAGGGPNDAAAAVDPAGRGPRLYFQRKPKSPTDTIPIHLDLNADDRRAEVARLVRLGATVVETNRLVIGDLTEIWTVMRDPEGNGFCVQ